MAEFTMAEQVAVHSEAPTIDPVTTDGWYECTDGTWIFAHSAADPRVFCRPRQHYSRPETPEERDERYASAP